MRSIGTAGLVGLLLLLAGTGPCAAQTYGPQYHEPQSYEPQFDGPPPYATQGHAPPQYGPEQPPPRSRYADGTGNVAVEALNAGQLDQNYRGPWYPVAAPGWMPPGAGRQAHPTPYGQPVYPLPGD